MANDKAVLVGINRYQYFNGLEGCLQDVTNMAAVLTGRFGFPAENVRTITDEDATKDAISDGMTWLLDGASPGDRLVFHFSGHGSFDSPDGNPPDGIDGDGLREAQDALRAPADHARGHVGTGRRFRAGARFSPRRVRVRGDRCERAGERQR